MHRTDLMQPRFVEDPVEHKRHVDRAVRQKALEAFAAVVGAIVLLATAMGWQVPW